MFHVHEVESFSWSTPQPAHNILRIFAEFSLSVAIFGTSREHLGNILKEKIF